jgi:hypothetical protein
MEIRKGFGRTRFYPSRYLSGWAKGNNKECSRIAGILAKARTGDPRNVNQTSKVASLGWFRDVNRQVIDPGSPVCFNGPCSWGENMSPAAETSPARDKKRPPLCSGRPAVFVRPSNDPQRALRSPHSQRPPIFLRYPCFPFLHTLNAEKRRTSSRTPVPVC